MAMVSQFQSGHRSQVYSQDKRPTILRRKRTESPGDFHSTGASYVRARTVGGRSLRVPVLTVVRTRYIKGSSSQQPKK
jgi:hypothetical protein